FTLPAGRSFAIDGEARVSSRVGDDLADLVLGVVGPTATSARRLPGSLMFRATSAIDGDPTTAWTSAFAAGEDSIEFKPGHDVTVDHLDLQVVADGRHSVPTHLTIESNGQPVTGVDIPAISDQHRPNAVVTVPLELPQPVTGSDLKFNFDKVREVTTTD